MFVDVPKDVGTGGDYTTWAAFFAAIPADISAGSGTNPSEVWIGNGLNEAFDEHSLSCAGITTDATGYPVMRSKTAVRRGAGSGFDVSTPGSGAAISPTGTVGAGAPWLDWNVDYGIIEDIEFTLKDVTSFFQLLGIRFGGGNDNQMIRGCLFHGIENVTNSSRAIVMGKNTNGLGDCWIINNVIWDTSAKLQSGAIQVLHSNPGGSTNMMVHVLNNTVYTSHSGAANFFLFRGWNIGAVTAKNNILLGDNLTGSSYLWQNLGGNSCVSDRCISADDTADDNGDGTHWINETTALDILTSITKGSEDAHLVDGSNAVNNGVQISGVDEWELDIDGQDRTTLKATFDIGADAVSTPLPPLDWAEIIRKRRLPATYRRHLIR